MCIRMSSYARAACARTDGRIPVSQSVSHAAACSSLSRLSLFCGWKGRSAESEAQSPLRLPIPLLHDEFAGVVAVDCVVVAAVFEGTPAGPWDWQAGGIPPVASTASLVDALFRRPPMAGDAATP
eukprot:GHVU01160906.1.p3 GENE.GHVU01160906.1~~GHVU01160906.1.p3  ORF type:complete len:125 (-),score=12.89 GHVU01160906.1:178-552(-)